MTTKPIFVCEDCQSEDCELQFAIVDGHKVPTLWHCNRCSWEGKMRKCIFVTVEPAPSPYAKKTAAEVRAHGPRARKEKVIAPPASKDWQEAFEKAVKEQGIPEELLQPASTVPSMWPQGEAAQDEMQEFPTDAELGIAEEPVPELGSPDPRSTCPISCPHCEEPLVVVYMQCSGSIKWTRWNYGIGDSEWKWITEETWTYSCPTCGEQLSRDDIDEIPDIF